MSGGRPGTRLDFRYGTELSLPSLISRKMYGFNLCHSYKVGFKYPRLLPSLALIRAIKPAYRGATALVPPTVEKVPNTEIAYPLNWLALPAMSGTPLRRPP